MKRFAAADVGAMPWTDDFSPVLCVSRAGLPLFDQFVHSILHMLGILVL